jgi:hypothetical protein
VGATSHDTSEPRVERLDAVAIGRLHASWSPSGPPSGRWPTSTASSSGGLADASAAGSRDTIRDIDDTLTQTDDYNNLRSLQVVGADIGSNGPNHSPRSSLR